MVRQNTRNGDNKGIFIELIVIFCLLVSMGFPGNLEYILGEQLGLMMEYGAFLLEIAVMLFSSANRWQDIEIIRLDKKYTMLYLFVAFLFAESMVVTRFPSEQMITCLRLVVTLLFVIWLQEYFSTENMVELFCMAQTIFLVMTVFFMVRYPYLAYQSGSTYHNALMGLYPSKNACATEFCFGIIMYVMVIRMKQRRHMHVLRWYAAFFLQTILLFLCQATGAIITAVISLTPLLLPDKKRLPLGLMYIAVNIVFLFSMLTLMPLFAGIIEAMGKDTTLTGRIPLWNQLINVMTAHHPLLGFGYGMFWRDSNAVDLVHAAFKVRTNSFFATMTSGAHNVILEMWANSGLLGLGAMFIALLQSFRSVDQLERDRYLICSTCVVFLMVNGLTERCLGGNYDFRTVAFFLALAIGCNQKKENPSSQLRAAGMQKSDITALNAKTK